MSEARILPSLLHQLRDEGGLAAGRGAQVQDGFARVAASSSRDGEQRAGVLHVKPAVAKTCQRGQRRMRFQFEDKIFAGPVARKKSYSTFSSRQRVSSESCRGIGLSRC